MTLYLSICLTFPWAAKLTSNILKLKIDILFLSWLSLIIRKAHSFRGNFWQLLWTYNFCLYLNQWRPRSGIQVLPSLYWLNDCRAVTDTFLLLCLECGYRTRLNSGTRAPPFFFRLLKLFSNKSLEINFNSAFICLQFPHSFKIIFFRMILKFRKWKELQQAGYGKSSEDRHLSVRKKMLEHNILVFLFGRLNVSRDLGTLTCSRLINRCSVKRLSSITGS